MATTCVRAGTSSCEAEALAWAVRASESGMAADTWGARAKEPKTVMTSRMRKAAVAEGGIFLGGAAAACGEMVLGLPAPVCADAAARESLAAFGSGSWGALKSWEKRTSFQTPRGVLIMNTAVETMVPVRAFSMAKYLSDTVSVTLAVRYVAAYRVHTTKTGLVAKKRRGCVNGQRRFFAKVLSSGLDVDTLSTTDLSRASVYVFLLVADSTLAHLSVAVMIGAMIAADVTAAVVSATR